MVHTTRVCCYWLEHYTGTQNPAHMFALNDQSTASDLRCISPRAVSPVLQSLLVVGSLNGSQRAVNQASKGASEAMATSSLHGSTRNGMHWTGLANATQTGEELEETTNVLTSLFDKVRTVVKSCGCLSLWQFHHGQANSVDSMSSLFCIRNCLSVGCRSIARLQYSNAVYAT